MGRHPRRSPAPQSRRNRHEMVVKTIVTPAAAAFELHCRARGPLHRQRHQVTVSTCSNAYRPGCFHSSSQRSPYGSISPTLRGIDEVVGRYEQSNGRSVKGAENFSWSGMSSAVRRLTQGAWAPNPHTSVIKCTSSHHDQFTCFPSTHPSAGAPDPDDGCVVDFLMHNSGLLPRLRAEP